MKSAAVLLITALLLVPPGAVLGATTERRLGQRPDNERGGDGPRAASGVRRGSRRRHTPAGRNDGGPSAYLRSERDRRRTEAGRSENGRRSIPDEDKGNEGPRENNGIGSGPQQGGPNASGGPTAAAAVALTRDGRSSLLSAGGVGASIPPAEQAPPDLDGPRKAASERRLSEAFGRLPARPLHARRGLFEPNCHLATKLWHADTVTRDGCTDDGNHVPSWLDNTHSLFFESAEECCSSLFYGQECEVRGPFCGEGVVDDGGGGGNGGCTATEHGWHADPANRDGCTNDDDFPSEWLETKSLMFYETAEGCCDMFFPGTTCNKRDCSGSGGGETTSDGGAGPGTTGGYGDDVVVVEGSGICEADGSGHGWHADMNNQDGCSNDSNFPKEWLSDNFRSHMLHPNPSDCCKAFLAGKQCKAYDSGCVYSAPTCEGGRWHPDALSRTGCSNDEPPAAWDDAKLAAMMFDSAADCCQVHHSGWTCVVRDHCSKTGVEYLTVTARPTEAPTLRPSSAPTIRTPEPTIATPEPSSKPTPPPTPSPVTPEPTEPLWVWYVDHFTGVCHHTPGVTVPHYIKSTYSDAGECCESSFNSEKCLDALPKDAMMDDGTSGQVPMSPEPTYGPTSVWYVDHFTGVCHHTATPGVTVPHYITSTYDDAGECCESSFNSEKCWEDALVNDGLSVTPSAQPVTWRPTYSPTQFFTGAPTSNAPSQRPTVITESPTAGACTDLTWRFRGRGCTNRPFDPTEPVATFLFETAAECCHAMFFAAGLTGCHVDDACMKEPLDGLKAEDFDSLRLSPSCVGDGALMGTTWHPDRRSMDGCTNSGDVPATWKLSDNDLFFGSPFDCCSSLYMNREMDCIVRDACLVWNGKTTAVPSAAVTRSPTHPPRTEEPSVREAVSVVNTDELCASAEWYLDFDAKRCSNEPGHLDETSSRRYDNKKSCCESTFGYADCPAHDVCGDDPLSSSKLSSTTPTTDRPTRRPTHTLTALTTALPTHWPTYPPTSRPVALELTCGDIKTKKKCKKNGWCAWTEGGMCVSLSEVPSDPDGCENRLWHPVPGGGRTCTNSLDYPEVWNYKPYSVKYFFDSAEACCGGLYNDGGGCIMVDACRH